MSLTSVVQAKILVIILTPYWFRYTCTCNLTVLCLSLLDSGNGINADILMMSDPYFYFVECVAN